MTARAFVWFLGFALLSACSTPAVYRSSLIQMESPEVNSSEKPFGFEIGLKNEYKAVLTSAIESVPVAESTTELLNANDPNPSFMDGIVEAFDYGSWTTIALRFGLFDRLELGWRGLRRVGAKFQVLGDPRGKSKAGNFALALHGGVVLPSTSTWTSGSDESGTALSPASLEMRSFGYKGAIIAGYRMADGFMPYLGGFYEKQSLRGTQTLEDLSTHGFEQSLTLAGANLGLEFRIGERGVLTLEGQIADGKLGRARRTLWGWAVQVGGYF